MKQRIILSVLIVLGTVFGARAQQLSTNVEETVQGQEWVVTFTFSEVTNYTALSLQLSLPEQLNAVDIVAGSALESTHQVLMGEIGNGLLNVILYSPQNTLLPGGGATFTLQLESTEKLGDAQQIISVMDIRLSDVQGVETKLSDQSIALQSNDGSYMRGDANGDGVVNTTDVILAIDKYLGNDVTINFSATDLNEDGIINTADAILILDIYLNTAGSSRKKVSNND